MTSDTDIFFDRDPEVVYLLNLLKNLIQSYDTARELMEKHMKVVALQNVVEIEMATQHLIDHYDLMAKLEYEFYEHVDALFKQFGVSADTRRLSVLAEYFPEHREEINTGRIELIEKVNSVQAQKNRLVGLLDKARTYNKSTMQLVRASRDGKSVRYDGLGEKSLSDDSSIIFNQKV